MTSPRVNTTYEPFSREPEYVEGNRAFVAELPLRGTRRMLDLACGVGTITELLLERAPASRILGVDLSRESLAIGHEIVAQAIARARAGGADPAVLLVQASADCLPIEGSAADLVFMGHSIHMLPDFDRLLAEVRRVLSPGGVFAFNSSFYAGSQAPGTDPFYQRWWKGALNWVMARDAELRAAGQPGIKRVRGTAPRAFSSAWPSSTEWQEILARNGFVDVRASERTIEMTQSSLETIGAYAGFARLMLSGYPEEIASEALVAAAGPAMRDENVTRIPRLWLEVMARKPDG